MSTKRRLVPNAEVRSVLDLLREYGINPAKVVIDIRGDGVTFSPPSTESGGDAYERWARKNAHRD